jgi:sigma-E factor negative regulatory protein RseB
VVRTLLAVILLTPCFSSHAEALDAWLDKMKQAMNSRNYEGTLIIRQQDHMQAMHVRHGVDVNGSWEVLESLSGESRKVIRKDGRVITIFPNRQLVTISRDGKSASLRPQLPEDRDILKKHYRISLVGEDRVARKPTQVVTVKPKDEFRYGFRFWLDKESGLLLKCDLMDAREQVIEQLMFSELSLLEQLPAPDLETDANESYEVVDLDYGRVERASNQWRVKNLPEGFVLTQASSKPSSRGEGLVHHMVFSDGMASVSVFVENRLPVESWVLNGFSSMGALNAYGQPVNGHHVTVIGEVPEATVRLIGQSIYRKNQDKTDR